MKELIERLKADFNESVSKRVAMVPMADLKEAIAALEAIRLKGYLYTDHAGFYCFTNSTRYMDKYGIPYEIVYSIQPPPTQITG